MKESPSVMTYKQRQIAEREKEILSVARRMFAEKGFFGTNLNDVAKEIGIARGTIYLHFETKEDLLAAIIRNAESLILEALQKVITPDDNPLEKLKKIFNAYLSACHQYEDLIKVMSSELRRAAHTRLYGKDDTSITKLVANTVEEGKKLGFFDPEIDTSIAANALFSIVNIETFRELREEKKLELKTIIDSAFKIYFSGIARKGVLS